LYADYVPPELDDKPYARVFAKLAIAQEHNKIRQAATLDALALRPLDVEIN
jgi:hypothetical protein